MATKIFTLCLLLLSCLHAYSAQQQSKKVAIIQFIEVATLNKNKEGITEVLEEHNIKYDYYNAQGQILIANQIATKVFANNYDAVITITTPITQVFKKARGDRITPIVFSAVTDPYGANILNSDSYLDNDFIVGIIDAPPIDETFDFINKNFAPKKIGLIYNPSEQNSVVMINKIKQRLANKFEFFESALTNSINAKSAADKFLGKVDVVYSPLDSTVLATMDVISKTLDPYNIPIVANDPGAVAKGATLAIGYDQKEVGREAAFKVLDIFNAKGEIEFLSSLKTTNPKNYIVKFNQKEMDEDRTTQISINHLMKFYDAIELGLIFALVSIGVFITFRTIDFPDMTVDGSFPLGAAVTALLISGGYNPFLAIFASILAGSLAGFITGMLNVRGGIIELLAGILTMTALYSINLRIMGAPNLSIINCPTIFSEESSLYLNLLIVLIVIAVVTYVLESEIGLAMRAVGVNEKCSKSQGVRVGVMKVSGLVFSNALVALCGSIFAQKNGFADISMGTGTVIVGLASVIIGENLMKTKTILWLIINCVLGSILYRICITIAINSDFIGIEASDLNLVTSIIVAVAMIIYKKRKGHI